MGSRVRIRLFHILHFVRDLLFPLLKNSKSGVDDRGHHLRITYTRRRGTSSTFLLSGPKTKTPRDWKSFMSNDENKTQLIKLLVSEWKKPKYSSRLRRRQLFFVCDEECFCLSSDDGIVVQALPEEDLFSSQEEADTRIILHYSHVARKLPTTFVTALYRFCQSIHKTLMTLFCLTQGWVIAEG